MLLTLSLLACSDYQFIGETTGFTPDEDTGIDCPETFPDCWGTTTVPTTTTTATTPDPEDCTVAVAAAGEVSVVDECQGSGPIGTITDPYDLVIENKMDPGTASGGAIVMPAVGNLTDDNGDGRIDELDVPDVAFTTWKGRTLDVWNGDGSGLIWSLPGYWGNAGVVVADVDVDGEADVITITSNGEIHAVNADGSLKWKSSPISGMASYPQPIVADLDADGAVEVIGDVGVVEGATGKTIVTLAAPRNAWRTPIAADIDQDGEQEIILGNNVYASSGTVKWSNSGASSGNFGAVADIDGDVGGEVFFVSGSTLYVHDEDGTQLHTSAVPGSNPGPPSVADFDGDGVVEIAIPANTRISVFEVDGTLVWESNINDTSGLAGCSGYDLDGDGAYEVLYADQDALRVYDGATGAILFENFEHRSGTLWEYPVIVDSDLDGSAEICIASNDNWTTGTLLGVTCYGHANEGWPKSGPTWGTHDFAVTNLNPDGSVPRVPEASWLKYNVFRARPAVDDPSAADLRVRLVDMCVADCTNGPIKVSVQVENRGVVDVPSGTPLTFFRNDADVLTPMATEVLPEIPAGVTIEGVVFVLQPHAFGSEGFIVSVDADGFGANTVSECFEDNNDLVMRDEICQ